MTEVTNSEKAAWRRLNDIAATSTGSEMDELLDELAPLLPDALTNPQPELPSEPGLYASHTDPHAAWKLHKDGDWWPPYQDYSVQLSEVHAAAPFTRLVPERPQVTREQLDQACSAEEVSAVNFRQARAILGFVNGTRS